MSGKTPIRTQLNLKWLKDRNTDYVESVLVHEMVHAYLLVIDDDDEGEHGESFEREMHRVNSCCTGSPVTIAATSASNASTTSRFDR